MRVISGLAGGYKLKSPDGIMTRPTADRIKESLFNKLAFDLPGRSFLDLFCGTGAIGIEALSRGAENAVFADISVDACRITEYNLNHTKLADKAFVINDDYISAIDRLAARDFSFDFIFADPPYYKGMANKAVSRIIERGLLKNNGCFIIEAAFDEKINCMDLYICSEKKYRAANITILRNKLEESD